MYLLKISNKKIRQVSIDLALVSRLLTFNKQLLTTFHHMGTRLNSITKTIKLYVNLMCNIKYTKTAQFYCILHLRQVLQGQQPLEHLKQCFQLKGYNPQILLDSSLNTLSHSIKSQIVLMPLLLTYMQLHSRLVLKRQQERQKKTMGKSVLRS